MPLTSDTNYSWSLSLYRWFRATEIYVPRALPSPAALLIVVAVPAAFAMRRIEAMPRLWDTSSRRVLAYAVAWFLVFIAPVLPVAGRSELYLYLAGFGFCLVAGQLTDRAWAGSRGRPITAVAMVLYILGLGGYQVVRATQSHQVLQFTGALVQSMHDDPWLRTYRGRFVLVPADPETERLLRDGIGDYLYLVLEDTLGRVDINGLTAYTDSASSGPRWAKDRVRVRRKTGEPEAKLSAMWLQSRGPAYAGAVLAVIVAIGATTVIRPWLAPSISLWFFPAVVVPAIYGGFGPALLAVVLSTASLAYFFVPPVYSFSIGVDDAIRLVVFAAVAYATAGVGSARRRAEAGQRRSLRELESTVAILGKVSDWPVLIGPDTGQASGGCSSTPRASWARRARPSRGKPTTSRGCTSRARPNRTPS